MFLRIWTAVRTVARSLMNDFIERAAQLLRLTRHGGPWYRSRNANAKAGSVVVAHGGLPGAHCLLNTPTLHTKRGRLPS
jgi:hypothetical protein